MRSSFIKKTVLLFGGRYQKAENQVSIIECQKDYLIWKQNFLMEKRREEKAYQAELHATQMRVLLLKERRLSMELNSMQNLNAYPQGNQPFNNVLTPNFNPFDTLGVAVTPFTGIR